MADLQEFKESPWTQRINEIIPYTVTVPTSWGQDPSVSSVLLYRIKPDGSLTDVSSTSLTGSNSVSGQAITTKSVTTLTNNWWYKLVVKFVVGTKTLEAWGRFLAKN